jgi:hypothetical protein
VTEAGSSTSSVIGRIASFSASIALLGRGGKITYPGVHFVAEAPEVKRRGEADAAAATSNQDDRHEHLPERR